MFISFEGGDGTGKTTQARLLADKMKSKGLDAVLVHEPGGTELGEMLRGWVKKTGREISPQVELLVFAAARAELVQKVISPALSSNLVVIADRYCDSTVAYQGYGHRIPLEQIQQINDIATSGVYPDLTFILDLEPELALERGNERDQGSTESRFENMSKEFHERVYKGFRSIALNNPERCKIVDAAKPINLIEAKIRSFLDI